jgi:hypothetical protein
VYQLTSLLRMLLDQHVERVLVVETEGEIRATAMWTACRSSWRRRATRPANNSVAALRRIPTSSNRCSLATCFSDSGLTGRPVAF